MSRALQLVLVEQPKASPLTPELKDFIDRAIVPALVKQYLAQIDLAKADSDAANCDRHTAALKLRTVRP